MYISDTFELEDKVSGLKLKIIPGEHGGILHIEHIGEPMSFNRDFSFAQNGELTGTGSFVG